MREIIEHKTCVFYFFLQVPILGEFVNSSITFFNDAISERKLAVDTAQVPSGISPSSRPAICTLLSV